MNKKNTDFLEISEILNKNTYKQDKHSDAYKLEHSYEAEFYDYLPTRDDPKYQEIENFNSYEFSRCIAHEMAIRNKDARKIIFILNKITALKDKLSNQNKYYYLLGNKKPYILNNYIVTDILVKKLREQYLLYPHDYKIKELEYISQDTYNSYNNRDINKNSKTILEYILNPIYSICESEEFGFKISQVLDKKNNSFETNIIEPEFSRKIYDTNQINVLLNLSLPKKEILAYIEHILDTVQTDIKKLDRFPYRNYLSYNIELINLLVQKKLSKKTFKNMNFNLFPDLNRSKIKSPLMRELLGKPLKTPLELLIGELEKSEQTENFPKIPIGEQMANLFFVYDYVTARIEHINNQNNEEKEEFDKEIQSIKSSPLYNYEEKVIQIEAAQQCYFENLTDSYLVKIIKEKYLTINNKIKSTMITKYYYAIKPYIDNCKYKELLTGVKMV